MIPSPDKDVKFNVAKAIITGSEAYHMIMRNALAPWTAGFQHKGMTFRPSALRSMMPVIQMGQAATPVSLAVRDQALATLNDAWQRAAAIDAWRAENPDWKLAMGPDGDGVEQLSATAAPLLPVAQKVRAALQSADPASWVVTSQEIADANAWATAVVGMYSAVSRHSTTLRPVTAATAPGTATTAVQKTDYTIPIAIGAGALLLLGLLFFKGRGD